MGKSLMADQRLIPELGPATSRFGFPHRNPDAILKTLRSDDRLFVQAELAVARCEFETTRKLYGQLVKSPRYFASALRFGVIAAIGLGDVELFDSIIQRVSVLRRTASDALTTILVDVVESWINQWLWIPTGYPEWICRFDFGDIPDEWRDAVAYLGTRVRLQRGQFESAYAAAALLMQYQPAHSDITARDAFLMMTRAIACRETGRQKEMMRWLEKTVCKLAPHGFLLPFLLVMHGSAKSPLESLLEEVRPDLVVRFREINTTYYKNLIRVRNHYLGEHVTDRLTFREMYLAILLKRGRSYDELSEIFEFSVGRCKNAISKIYEKLGIHSRAELQDLVW